MFESATIKLTAWYLGILLIICLFFSFVIFQISISEVKNRLNIVEKNFDFPLIGDGSGVSRYNAFQTEQLQESQINLFFALFYANLAITLVGGIGSYALARRTLRPIEEFQEARSRFTSDASHELRTPLAVMKSEIELAMKDPHTTKKDLQLLLASNLEEVDRMSALSTMLLKLSKSEHLDVELKEQNIFDSLNRAIELQQKRIAREIKLESKSSQLAVAGDGISLVELWTILLENAIRYSPKDSAISIKITSKQSLIKVTITNEGEGIAESDIPQIFDRFYRGEKSRSTESGGYGLGLSLAKNIVSIHQGSIDIESKRNKYTSVNVYLKKST